jgi:hypothetical protein
MKTILILLFTASFLSAKDRIAVLNLNSFSVDSTKIPIVVDKLYFEIQQTNMFTIVDRQNINKVFEEQRLQLTGVTDSTVEIGRILNVQYILTGSFGELDESSYYFSLKLVNVETAEVATNYFTIEGTFKSFILSAPKTCLARLLKLEDTPQSKPANVKELDVFSTTIKALNYNRPQETTHQIFVPCMVCGGKGTIYKKLGTTMNPYRCSTCMGFKYSGPETNYQLVAGKLEKF